MNYLKLEIVNHHYNENIHIVEGTYEEVEARLRLMFPGPTEGVPEGDLYTVIMDVARAHGVELGILGGVMPERKPHLHPQKIAALDPDESWRK